MSLITVKHVNGVPLVPSTDSSSQIQHLLTVALTFPIGIALAYMLFRFLIQVRSLATRDSDQQLAPYLVTCIAVLFVSSILFSFGHGTISALAYFARISSPRIAPCQLFIALPTILYPIAKTCLYLFYVHRVESTFKHTSVQISSTRINVMKSFVVIFILIFAFGLIGSMQFNPKRSVCIPPFWVLLVFVVVDSALSFRLIYIFVYNLMTLQQHVRRLSYQPPHLQERFKYIATKQGILTFWSTVSTVFLMFCVGRIITDWLFIFMGLDLSVNAFCVVGSFVFYEPEFEKICSTCVRCCVGESLDDILRQNFYTTKASDLFPPSPRELPKPMPINTHIGPPPRQPSETLVAESHEMHTTSKSPHLSPATSSTNNKTLMPPVSPPSIQIPRNITPSFRPNTPTSWFSRGGWSHGMSSRNMSSHMSHTFLDIDQPTLRNLHAYGEKNEMFCVLQNLRLQGSVRFEFESTIHRDVSLSPHARMLDEDMTKESHENALFQTVIPQLPAIPEPKMEQHLSISAFSQPNHTKETSMSSTLFGPMRAQSAQSAHSSVSDGLASPERNSSLDVSGILAPLAEEIPGKLDRKDDDLESEWSDLDTAN